MSTFFFNDAATTEIYTLSLHDALPICFVVLLFLRTVLLGLSHCTFTACTGLGFGRSEEHTSELQSRLHLVCRLLLEKKKMQINIRRLQTHKVNRYKSIRHLEIKLHLMS